MGHDVSGSINVDYGAKLKALLRFVWCLKPNS